MEHSALRIDVPENDGVFGELHVAEADNLVAEWTALLGRYCPVDEFSAAPAGDDKARRMACKLQVLQIVVVPGDPEIHLVLAKECIPVADKDLLVFVDAVCIDRVMGDAGDERGSA